MILVGRQRDKLVALREQLLLEPHSTHRDSAYDMWSGGDPVSKVAGRVGTALTNTATHTSRLIASAWHVNRKIATKSLTATSRGLYGTHAVVNKLRAVQLINKGRVALRKGLTAVAAVPFVGDMRDKAVHLFHSMPKLRPTTSDVSCSTIQSSPPQIRAGSSVLVSQSPGPISTIDTTLNSLNACSDTTTTVEILTVTAPVARDVQIICCDLTNPLAALHIAKELKRCRLDDKVHTPLCDVM